MKPIAVITVTYSPGEYLGRFVDSLARATTRGTYTVLADNGSTDGVPEDTAATHPAVEFLPTGGNVGYGTAINIAVTCLVDKREKGEVDDEYFIISNPDVEFGEGSIDTLIECASRWPDAACVGPRSTDDYQWHWARTLQCNMAFQPVDDRLPPCFRHVDGTSSWLAVRVMSAGSLGCIRGHRWV